ncbi:hypothetical protein J421_3889 [Gemmatirosa kalamazoonensis]|uniref:Uncharacterized protein n=1 Tax=Gemmatirosa kalamazoonensis TaxID=861299 RepID=W0RKY1_9BACT|nr:hypothetical protein [Gemmatirosa kalamazoonensis]AHG91426.1 hypothetical protein J421_3889 [Gemmatirosa kalamazoonensis]
MPRPSLALGPVAALLLAATARAQTEYHDTDAGRPLRIEDATATARYALGVQLPPLRVEHTASGVTRLRAEPKLSYGVLPRTEVELRATLLYVPPSGQAPRRAGVAGIGVSALHALTIETPDHPALALAADVLLPVGSFASPLPVYSGKAMLTRTFRAARVHVNGALGTWNLSVPNPLVGCGPNQVAPPGTSCPFVPEPFIPDTPCDVAPMPDASDAAPSARLCGAPATASASTRQLALSRTRYGRRWFLGAAVDRAVAVHSVLLAADVYAESFERLYGRPDVGAEIGARHQVAPNVVLDAGIGRRVAGVNRATLVTLGATLTVAARPLVRAH